jgi:SlyX protein
MNEKLQKLEEKIAILQNDLSIMSDEIYSQQKLIQELKLQIKVLKSTIQSNNDRNKNNDSIYNEIPPHY